jgi:ring-1,2-phenylacetyl-CoA epoxidase subunit PaaD
VTVSASAEARVWEALRGIADPEIPSISVVDLGVIGAVEVSAERIHVDLLPTFVGCPAIGVMRQQIGERLGALGIAETVEVDVSYDPPWTSDRISEAGRERLRASGFAPPGAAPTVSGLDELMVLSVAECPYCGSRNTTLDNAFGPTLCRSIHHCADCSQPFERFKTL